MSESNGIRDFTPEQKPPIQFRLYSDVYEAASDLPAGTLLDFIGLADQLGGATEADAASKLGLIADLFNKVLLPASAATFRERLRDLEKPIPVAALPDILGWLLETYTGRPLAQQQPSPDGQGNDGPKSTADVPLPELIPSDSPPTGS